MFELHITETWMSWKNKEWKTHNEFYSSEIRIMARMFWLIIWSLSIALVHNQNHGNVFKPQPLKPGPWVKMTHGAIWPKPANQTSSLNFFVIDQKNFKFQVSHWIFLSPTHLCFWIRGWVKKSAQAQKLANSKNSTILVQS